MCSASPSPCRSALAALMLAFASIGCPKRLGPALSEPDLHDAEKLWSQLRQRASERHELRGQGKARLHSPKGDLSVAVNIAARAPADLRFEALSFFGEPVALLVTSSGEFALFDVRAPAFYTGRANAKNLAELLPVALEPDEFVSVLLGAAPALPAGVPREVVDAGDAVELRLSVLPHPLRAVASEEERVIVGRDLRVLRVQRLATGPSPAILWTAAFDDFADDRRGRATPTTFHLSSGEAGLDLSLTTAEVDPEPPLPDGAFALGAPAGVPAHPLP